MLDFLKALFPEYRRFRTCIMCMTHNLLFSYLIKQKLYKVFFPHLLVHVFLIKVKLIPWQCYAPNHHLRQSFHYLIYDKSIQLQTNGNTEVKAELCVSTWQPSEEFTNVSFSFLFMCVWKIIMQNILFWYLYVGHINYWLGANTITTKCLFLACICSTWLVGANQMKWKFNNLFLTSFFSALTTQFF